MDGAAGEYSHVLGFEALPERYCSALPEKVQAFQIKLNVCVYDTERDLSAYCHVAIRMNITWCMWTFTFVWSVYQENVERPCFHISRCLSFYVEE